MKSVMGMLRRETNKQILRGNSAVLSSLNTLNGSVLGGNGFLEPRAAVAGTQQNVVGGISKVTFPVAGWLNQFSNGALVPDFMSNLYNMYISANSVSPMGDVDHVIFSQAALARYRKELFDIQRWASLLQFLAKPWMHTCLTTMVSSLYSTAKATSLFLLSSTFQVQLQDLLNSMSSASSSQISSAVRQSASTYSNLK